MEAHSEIEIIARVQAGHAGDFGELVRRYQGALFRIVGNLVEENNGRPYPILVDDARAENLPKITVPHGSCYVLGDNRSQSKDSRIFGPIPLADVRGRVDYIYWPAASWSRFGRFER